MAPALERKIFFRALGHLNWRGELIRIIRVSFFCDFLEKIEIKVCVWGGRGDENVCGGGGGMRMCVGGGGGMRMCVWGGGGMRMCVGGRGDENVCVGGRGDENVCGEGEGG